MVSTFFNYIKVNTPLSTQDIKSLGKQVRVVLCISSQTVSWSQPKPSSSCYLFRAPLPQWTILSGHWAVKAQMLCTWQTTELSVWITTSSNEEFSLIKACISASTATGFDFFSICSAEGDDSKEGGLLVTWHSRPFFTNSVFQWAHILEDTFCQPHPRLSFFKPAAFRAPYASCSGCSLLALIRR